MLSHWEAISVLERRLSHRQSAVMVWVFLRLTGHSHLGLHHQILGMSIVLFAVGLPSGFVVITVLPLETGMLVLPLSYL